MEPSQVQAFEDQRWSSLDQELVWRHEAALSLVVEEPVLDVGGGDGLFLTLLREKKGFRRLTLLEVSPVALEKASRKGLDAHIADITKPFPFPDKAFATVCALDVFEHLYDPIPTLKEMARVAQWVVIVVPNFHYWKDRAYMLVGKIPFQCKPRRGHVHWFNYPMLKKIIAQVGLEVDTFVFGGFRRLGPVGDWLAMCQPNLFAHSFAMRLKYR